MRKSDVPPVPRTEPLNTTPPVVYPPPAGATLWPLFGGLPDWAEGLTPRGGRPMLTPTRGHEKTTTVRCRMPLYRHRRYLCRSERTGEPFYFDLAFMPAKRWRRTAWSASPAWRTIRLGPFVAAWSFTF